MKKKAVLKNELIIAVDFDGTITENPNIGDDLSLREDAKEVLERLHEDGIQLILWTCRTGKLLDQALEFLKNNDMLQLFASINENIPEVKKEYKGDARKVGADIYIDDKNIFNGNNVYWSEIENFIYGEDDLVW